MNAVMPEPVSTTVRRLVTVVNEQGLHMVPCSRIVQAVRTFEGEIRICRDEVIADAKSMFDLLQLAAGRGTQLTVEATGAGASEVVEQIASLFATGFAAPDRKPR